jgi:hypothetical protein
MIPHPIRLRQPWDEVPAKRNRWKAFRRSFNRPTGLESHETVCIEIDRAVYCGEVALNGISIGKLETSELFATEITALLRAANELVVEVDPTTAVKGPIPSSSIYVVDTNEPPSSPIGEVRLLIRAVSAR